MASYKTYQPTKPKRNLGTMESAMLQQLIAANPFAVNSDDGLTIVTGPVRLQWVNFIEPTSPPGTTKEKRYNCYAAVPHGSDYALLTAARNRAWATSQWAALTPANDPLKLPASMVRKPTAQNPVATPWEVAAHSVIGFNTETKDPVSLFDMYTDAKGELLRLDPQRAKAGYWYRLKVRADAYNVSNSTGVKFWLQAAQLIAVDTEIASFDPSAGFKSHGQAPAGHAPAAMPAANAGFGTQPTQAPAANGFGAPAQMPAANAGFGAPNGAAPAGGFRN